MKKSILAIVIAIAFVAMAVPAHAAIFNGRVGETAAVTTIIGGAIFAPSTGVYVSVKSSTVSYCVASVHNSALTKDAGKEFASTSESATISYASSAGISAIAECADENTMPTVTGGTWSQ